MQAKYDFENPPALRRLIAAGAKLQPFSQEILEASHKAADEVYADLKAKNANFKKMYEAMMAYRNDQYFWWRIGEYPFDNFQIRHGAR
jgi:TRAP-type mannitol/chloroaromatic compound transport system substrate-binding protein